MSDTPGVISAMTRLRNYFLTGFIVCAPLAITAYIAWSFIGWVDSWVKPYIPSTYDPDTYLGFPVPGFGLIVALILITLIGFLTANFIGRSIVGFGEHLLSRMPFVRSIYSALKQIFETVLSNKADMFSTVGIIEYPRKGVWSIVFVANEKDSEINNKLNGRRRRPDRRGFHALHAKPDHWLPFLPGQIRDHRIVDDGGGGGQGGDFGRDGRSRFPARRHAGLRRADSHEAGSGDHRRGGP